MKSKVCIDCNKEVPKLFSRGRCQYCAGKAYAAKSGLNKPKKKSSSVMEDKKTLDDFFNKVLTTKTQYSEESGKMIFPATRSNVCHLFPKRNHKSVMNHPLNYIILTMDEHAMLDSFILDMHDFHKLDQYFPNSKSIILERMNAVLKDIEEETKFKESFKKYYEEN